MGKCSIKQSLIKRCPNPSIDDSTFIAIVDVVADALFNCYPKYGKIAPDKVVLEFRYRIAGWYKWAHLLPYKGSLWPIAENMVKAHYKLLLDSPQKS